MLDRRIFLTNRRPSKLRGGKYRSATRQISGVDRTIPELALREPITTGSRERADPLGDSPRQRARRSGRWFYHLNVPHTSSVSDGLCDAVHTMSLETDRNSTLHWWSMALASQAPAAPPPKFESIQ